jgi:hypothetical protein
MRLVGGDTSQPRLSRAFGRKGENMSEAKTAGWRINTWRKDFKPAISTSQIHEWINDRTLPSVKIGGMRLITISPEQFVERHREPAA